MENKIENTRALAAKQSRDAKEDFLRAEQMHILRLTAKITRRPISMSDEEWSVALRAVSGALDSYDESKGDFWSYAALVISSRLKDMYRSDARHSAEMTVRPEAFEGDVEEDAPDFSLQLEVQQHIGVSMDTSLREEIEALQGELSGFGISFFDLVECSPKAEKTRLSCAALVRAFFAPPPPLVEKLRKSGILPAKELLGRSRVSRKILDRYRKYLITSALILDGDYPGLADYLSYIKKSIQTEGGFL